MKKIINNWRWLGLSKETIESFSDRVSSDNLRILQTQSAAVAVLCFVSSIIMMFLDYRVSSQLVLLISSCANVILFIIAGHIRKNGGTHFSYTMAVNILILFYDIFSFWVSIFLDISYADSYAVLLVGAIIIAEISYDADPLQNLITVVLTVCIFGLCSRGLKAHEIHVWDMSVVGSFAVIGGVFSWKKTRIRYEREEALAIIKRSNSILYQTSLTDPLTGLFNRRVAFEKLEVLSAQCNVTQKEIVCMLLDLDNFKEYNDTYGHLAGDNLLKDLGSLLLEVGMNNNVVISRIGGEEFLAFFSEDSKADVEAISNSILEGVKKLHHPDGDAGKYSTISIGVYKNIAQHNDTSEKLYSKADCALYEAKKQGRNRVAYYDNNIDAI